MAIPSHAEHSSENTAKKFHQRISITPTEPAYTQDDIETEIIFGRNLAAKILAKYPPLKAEKINQYVNKVGLLLTEHSSRPELNYHFIVLDTPIINAFAAPGGYIFITKGALDQVQDEAELAGILAHEIAHVELRHYVKKIGLRSQKASKEKTLTAIISGGGASAVKAFSQALDETLDILFKKGLNSKKDELESDQYATWLLANTGYDPTALKRYFQRIQTLQAPETRVLTHTHPPLKERIEHLDALIQNNQLSQNQLVKLEERFHENVQ